MRSQEEGGLDMDIMMTRPQDAEITVSENRIDMEGQVLTRLIPREDRLVST
jgi:hypothetical protein